MTLTYSIYYPGGNTTALVNQLIIDPKLKTRINNQIMAINPLVEQVGFIDPKKYQLEMAGGEFCGNATRCAAFDYLKGKPGKIKLKVSGVSNKLMAGIDNQGNVWAQMPIMTNPVAKRLGYTVIKLEGITQVVTNSSPGKRKARNILKKLGLLNSAPAVGVMFIKKDQDKIRLDPFVYVRDIKTFFNETACASGTAAVVLYLAKKINRSIDLPVIQPSGETITASVQLPQRVSISGPIKILKKSLIFNL